MSSKVIIVTTLALLLVGFSILFVVEARNHNYDYKKDWVAVYFENPGDNLLDFAVENHEGEKITYSYKIFINDDKAAEKEIEIEKGSPRFVSVEAGAKQKISPVLETNTLNRAKKIMIIVSNKDTEYKIYKNIK